jgi:hypothetical protein
MSYIHNTLQECFAVAWVDLNVLKTKRTARVLYQRTLGSQYVEAEKGYYADGEYVWGIRFGDRRETPAPKTS